MTDMLMTDIKEFAKYFDHTLLKPEATPDDIRALCREAAELGAYSVCVNSRFVALARETLDSCMPGADGRDRIKVASVVGFPLGAMSTEAKAFEAEKAASNGADEIDMVIMIGSVKAGCRKMIVHDISAVKRAIGDKVLKVIVETGLLTDGEILFACECAIEAGADFLKTSTGFGHGGAEVRHIRMMKEVIDRMTCPGAPAEGREIKIKASGGIRDLDTALSMIEAGAERIGASATAAILGEAKRR